MKHWWPQGLICLYQSSWAAIAIVGVRTLATLLNHPLWRDEMNVWLSVRDSPTFAALVENIHYDRAHPGLWHLYVAALHTLFDQPIVMQIGHWLLGMGSLALFWRFSAFAQWQKWLFSFGYLPFYEYSIVARNYALGMFFLFAICALWPTRRRAYWPLAGLIVLLANSNVYALWIAISIAFTLLLELLFDPKLRHHWWDIGGSGILIGIGCAVSLYFIVPPSVVAAEALAESFFYFDLDRLLSTLGRLFAGYYIFIPNRERWLDVMVCSGVAIAVFVLMLLRLIHKPSALAFYLTANGLFLGFTYTKFMPLFMRHFGNFFLVLIAALWLAQQSPPSTAITRFWPRLESWAGRSRPACGAFLSLMLLFHLGGGLFHVGRDWVVPHSAGRAAAAYIREVNLQDTFMVGSRDAELAPLSGYVDRQIYYPERREIGSYTLFFKGDRREVTQTEVIRQTRQLVAQHPEMLLVLTSPLQVATPGLAVDHLASFERSQNETYHLYTVAATPSN